MVSGLPLSMGTGNAMMPKCRLPVWSVVSAPTTSGLSRPNVIPIIAAVLAIIPTGRELSSTITHFSSFAFISSHSFSSVLFPVKISRYTPGESPISKWKYLLKWLWSENPVRMAASTGEMPCSSSFFASPMRSVSR